ncbi:rhodanese-like domain-containing protein [Faunimonas sp. B44]|uniref:rhodanese-like domain-containing protein n=1 Tax=Faunimonas sp. B44 TaxID=3461493 RepID=UPI004043E063
MTRRLSPAQAKALIEGPGESAFLDLREAGEFGEGHPLLAIPCPYSTLELRIGDLVPRRDAPVLLIDGGDGVAERAARRLEAAGYTDIAMVEGGAPAWRAAGFTLFKGVNVPSKTLGELAEAVWHPKTISAGELADWQATGRNFRFFDCRPPAEHAKMRVPGAVCLPNGELPYRFAAAVPDPETPVVVTCAGRTRGIVGAIGLAVAGIRNPVFALENGTQGWALAGQTLERGNRAAPYPEPMPDAKAAGAERARAIAARFAIPLIGRADLDRLADDPSRTLYRIDVRSAEEYAAGHLPGAVHAPGVQIVQATDQWIGVRRSRVVLLDDNCLRGVIAAFWLKQLGYEVFVMPGSDMLPDAETGIGASRRIPGLPEVPAIGAAEARQRVAAGAALIDLRGSQAHRAGAPDEAVWSIRPRLDRSPAAEAEEVVLVAERDDAGLAALDLAELGVARTARFSGPMDDLARAGFAIAPRDVPPGEAIDFLAFVHDRHDGNLDASRRYLAWEQGLVAQLDGGERATFALATPA